MASAIAWAEILPWSQVAGQAALVRLFLSTLTSPALPLYSALTIDFPSFPPLYLILAQPSGSCCGCLPLTCTAQACVWCVFTCLHIYMHVWMPEVDVHCLHPSLLTFLEVGTVGES